MLVLDCHYLCYRSYYAIEEMSFKGRPTNILFGVLSQLKKLQNIHNTKLAVFCFDQGFSLRRGLLPLYKANRHATPEDKQRRLSMSKQINLLRSKVLPALGYSNVFAQEGYEADDLIASICQTQEDLIIVSSDHDLYQLLRPDVWMWNPHKEQAYNLESFRKEWGLEPSQWTDVKAIAGCTSDNIPGIKGVGDKTAAKFLRGELKRDSKAYTSIVSGNTTWKKNLSLVRLPFAGTPELTIRRDNVTQKKWDAVLPKLGITSLELD